MINHKKKSFKMLIAIIVLSIGVGCNEADVVPTSTSVSKVSPTITNSPVPTPTNSPAPTATAKPTLEPSEISSSTLETTSTPLPEPVSEDHDHEHDHDHILYEEDFTTLEGNWPELVFDHFYIGYHEPEWYHIEIQNPNDSEVVVIPEESFDNFTTDVKVFVETDLTEANGDYRYGLVFRRSGDQYYGFTISPITKQWTVLKNSPSEQQILAEGTDGAIQGLETPDQLRVDVKEEDFTFYINGHPVAQVSDPSYTSGELGFFVETFDNPKVHIHYDQLSIQDITTLQLQGSQLYEDNFTTLKGNWPQLVHDNFYIGYHEPEWYHIEVQEPNDDAIVVIPEQIFDDFTSEVEVFVETNLTELTGDFRYGLIFHRTGNQWYAFTISPLTQQWTVLKSSSSGLEVLAEGSNENIHGLEVADKLRVDASGPNFFFYIDNQVVSSVSDLDYTSGEMGFIVQTFDSPKVHIHYDALSVQGLSSSENLCSVTAMALNMREGPSTAYDPLTPLVQNTSLKPLGRNPDGSWIKVRVQGNNQLGWVSNGASFVSCNVPVESLPVSEP